MDLKQAAAGFLASDGIAVVGVSRNTKQAANHIYRRLRGCGTRVFAVNGKTSSAEGDPCYPDLRSIPAGVEGAFLFVPPGEALGVVRQCRERGVRRVWIHGTFGTGAVSAEAVAFCRENGMEVIAGACPLMYLAPVDGFHGCLRAVLRLLGRMPQAS